MSNAHPGRILAQDMVPPDGAGEMLSAQPISQAEIDDLLYGEDRPAEERLARLREISALLHDQEPGDFGDDDPGVLAGAIDEAIARLSGAVARDLDLENDAVEMDDDPLNHRETLAPDSDELEAIEADDTASLSSDEPPRTDGTART
ncbi:MAG: hypothetical protein ABIO40_05205 [Devosia sp.]